MKNSHVGKLLTKIIHENGKAILLLMIAVIGVVVTSLVPPQLLRRLIDVNLTPQNYDGLLRLTIFYFISIILIGVFDFIKEALLTILGQKITTEIRSAMMQKLERMHLRYYTSNSTGITVSRFMNDVDAVNSMFTNGIVGMVIDCFKVIGIVVSIWLFQIQLGLITLLLLPVIALITRSFQSRMLQAQIKNRILVSKVNNHIGESIKNILTIKVFSKEAYMENKYKDYLTDNYRTVEKVNFYDSVFPPIIQITRAFVIGLIVVLSSKHLNFLGISVGMVAASIELITNLFAPIEQLGMELQSIQQAISGVQRVNEFLSEKEDDEKDLSLTAEQLIPNMDSIHIRFHNVSFQYEEGTKVLQEIDFTIHPYEKVAFAGRTGVGKSTLFKLMLGLIKPNRGEVTINGYDVSNIPNSEKRKIFGYVDQSFPMINGTVGEQISLQDPSISRNQVINALEFVGLHGYVQALEQGLDTRVKDTTFSQGQKQLLSIARAIVTNPPILLLDEITANLDSITENHILSVLNKACEHRIILSISHRLSGLVTCDRIILLENGRVKNDATPDKLLQMDDWYRSKIELEHLTWD